MAWRQHTECQLGRFNLDIGKIPSWKQGRGRRSGGQWRAATCARGAAAARALALCALALWGTGGGGRRRQQQLQQQQQRGGPGSTGEPPRVSELPPPVPRRPANNASSAVVAAAAEALSENATLSYRSLVYRLNFDQPVRNAGRFPARPDVVLVVQVHDRAEHLRLLLESLRRAPGVENVLLVLSHDLWAEELNRLAARVDFCPVLQVFFPFSIQLYPREFPGHDPRDCPRDVGRAAALRLGCLNAEFPDSFGHYREARFAQTKHHWWWKLHFVWERVRALRQHAGPVLFLEEDHYLAPDFYHVLKRLWALRQTECPECQLVSLGTYSPVRGGFAGRADKVELKTWKSTEHNMGMAFGRDTYQKLIECTDAFCTYDDYNWDWTLQHLTVSCLPKFWKVLVPEIPRIFHTGDCGMHHKKSCRPSTQSAKIDSLLNSNQQYLFPEAMSVSKRYSMAPLSPHVKNGGWGDIRDHELCKSYRRLQ
ncbi:alpha-1,6-mannosyl-glycoprotein 2-beta-N-acetylglucosaminyltransferase [Passer montanus]|uniref:alpha-1,6-mannosyl-glycoprotein 2-beta-N-acetylglucosaminyltransferase n=1 Tax=Passer montanus TaxID=9160 RepID=UPI0019601DE4|nr:alpha-1,6-mannosyl-glycoprotein 2-beta-N-acetylglucosaminyltransferase [Passer montanus]